MPNFLDTSNVFDSFTFMHGYPIIVLSVIAMVCLFWARHQKKYDLYTLGAIISCIPMLSVLARMVVFIALGEFSYVKDLPFHLCRLSAILMPFLFIFRNDVWLKRMYFIILAGCLQAVITPDVEYYHPHFEYWLYWFTHVLLVWLPIYIVYVLRLVPTFKDVRQAYFALIGYALFTMILNLALGSNYFFTSHKPAKASLLDTMGPWPIYLVVGAAIAGVLFLLCYLPFLGKEFRSKKKL